MAKDVSGYPCRKQNEICSWTRGRTSDIRPLRQNGHVEMVADRTDHHKMFGLSYGGTNQDYTDIDYALYSFSVPTLSFG
jgi:hypothetical protein